MTRSWRHLGMSLVVTALCAAVWYAGQPAQATARLSLLTAWLPARATSQVVIADALRYE